MKKQYQAPITRTVKLLHQGHLMTGSPTRNILGDPTSNGLPTGVGSTSDVADPFGGNGQDGNSTRSREFDWFE